MSTDINVVNLIGRLTKDMEMRYTSGGTAVGNFSIALNEDVKQGDNWEERTHFIECVLWGRQAETLNPYLLKGKQVGIAGKLRQEKWEDRNTGDNRYKIVVVVNRLQLLQGGQSSNAGTSGQNQGYTQSYGQSGNNYTQQPPVSSQASFGGFGGPEDFDDDSDIPF